MTIRLVKTINKNVILQMSNYNFMNQCRVDCKVVFLMPST